MIYRQISSKFATNFYQLLSSSKKIAITSHTSPDDDAVASSLAMYHLITTKYRDKYTQIIYSNKPVTRYQIFQHYNKINFTDDLVTHLSDFDAIIFLDGSQFDRFTKTPDFFKVNKLKTICIDHHSSPPNDFNLAQIIPNATSTSEIIFNQFFNHQTIDIDLAKIFLLGILGDTGTFNYIKPNQLKTFDNVKKLVKIANVEMQDFKAGYNKIPKKILRIIGEYIKNTKYVNRQDKLSFQYTFLSRKFIIKNKLTNAETSSASHIYMASFLRAIENYPWGFVVTPKDTGCGVSLRSLPGSVSCRNISERMGIGGGHDRVSGGAINWPKSSSKKDYHYALKQMLDWIKNNKLKCI